MNARKLVRMARRFGGRGYAVAGACAVLAIGAIVLLRAPGHAAPRGHVGVGPGTGTFSAAGASQASFSGPGLNGRAALSHGSVLAHGTRSVLAELTFQADADAQGAARRIPVALSVVLDTSGSMSGEKIEQAKRAVRQLVERMQPEDRVALVTYNHTAQVLQPLALVSDVRRAIDGHVDRIFAGGGTVIPAALELGAAQLANAPGTHVRRVVLVSDGLDGSGQAVEAVAASLRSEAARGVYASSLGIGADYDERFLTTVADAGRGNYEFLASGGELDGFLVRELEQASSTVVEQVAAALRLPDGWRVQRALGAELEMRGGEAVLAIGPMFRGDARNVVVELTVDAGAPGDLAGMDLEVRYRTTADGEQHRIGGGRLALTAVPSTQMADASRDAEVWARANAVVLEEEQARAVEAWRAGDVTTARQISARNVATLRELQAEAPAAAPELSDQISAYEQDGESFDSISAGSAEGRAYGLGSNAARRKRMRR